MMSRISGNQTNNSEQPNASVSGVYTTAAVTDLASAAALNKQRKKRKKKKDKISLTNQAVNCSCGKRIESSCNSVSTCSNCVPTACVYCHFNDLAYCENYFAEHSSRFQGDLYDLNIKNNTAINFWPHKTETNDIQHDIGKIPASDKSNHFMRQQRSTVGLNRRTEQLQRFAVYENLCEFCGFAIGNGAYHLHCDANKQHSQKTEQDIQKSENIYENICESCHSLFDGAQCMSEKCKRNQNSAVPQESVPITTGEVIDVLVKKPPITNRQFGKQFSEFLGSFKQKLTPKTNETERKKPKIEIIHNIDGVFKTNKTFDLNEIVQLKNQSFCGEQSTNTCTELINSNNGIGTDVPSKPIRLYRTSNSDSNFLENYRLTPHHLQSPYSESIVSDTILYSNSYAPPTYEDAIQHSRYASVSPFKLRARIKPRIYDSTSASSFFSFNSSSISTLQSHSLANERNSPTILSVLFDSSDDSVRQWMISLKQQTHEYVNDSVQFECGSTKCLPSKMLTETASKLKRSIEHGKNMNSSNANSDIQTNLLHRIELFKENLMEQNMHSKRNAIYIKDSMCDVSMDATLSPSSDTISIVPDIETTNAQHSSLLPYCKRNSTENSDEIVYVRQRSQLAPIDNETHEQHINHNVALDITSQYLQMLKAFYMEQVTLSTSLNRITLVCGDRRIHFTLKFLMSQTQNSLQCSNKIVQPTRYTNIQQIIELIHIMGITKQLGERDKGKAITQSDNQFGIGRLKIPNAFLMRSSNLVARTPLRLRHKKSIDDFIKRKHATFYVDTEKVKTLDDFSKPTTKDSNIFAKKSLTDFTVKKTDYSSNVMDTCYDKGTQNRVGSEMKRKDNVQKNEENIYQSIWMFKTIGTANDTTCDSDSLNNLDMCKNESNEPIVHDGSQWEIAKEEFLFSSERIDNVQYSNDTRPLSHTTDSEIQMPKVDATTAHNSNEKPFYQAVCVLYNSTNPRWNEIIYDYNGNSMNFCGIMEKNKTETSCANNQNKILNENESLDVNKVENQPNKLNLCNDQRIKMNLDSVNAWKKLLRTVDYNDDEEDVILSESYLLNQKSAEYNNQNNDNLQSAQSDESISDTTKSSIQSDKTEETDLSSDLSINSSTSQPTTSIEGKNKKESGFLNKLQYRRFDIGKGNSKKDDVVQGLFYKNLNGKTHTESSPPMEIKRLNQTGTMVFGVNLEEVEKDDKLSDIPKFVVECIKVIELEENMKTNGIYRASGKKDSIDKLRKKMNESKLRKGTKYVSLKDEDVHTITGALKQFFRELKTELIPENIVKNLPNDLESESSIVEIRNGINTIDYLSRETLKYLLQHLIRVDANKEFNLMNASNLSIVWGAALFTSSVSITNAFETSDLLRRNTLIKVLIQHYDEIFIDIDRLI